MTPQESTSARRLDTAPFSGRAETPAEPSPTLAVSFDGQAADFDQRAGLPPGVAPQIAAAIAELAQQAQQTSRVPMKRSLILDLGAGTGQLGEPLVRLLASRNGAGRHRYLGLDVSGPMLTVFRRKLGNGASGALVRADASCLWPIATGSVDLLFLSRAAHLLPPTVLVEEALRVVADGGRVVLGGVRTDPDSLRAVLRRQMRLLLAEHGVAGRNAAESRHQLAEAFAERGGELLPETTAASWAVIHRAGDALAAWRAKPGLGGRAVAPEVQECVLRRLEEWIGDRYGSLDVACTAAERYALMAIRPPGLAERNLGAPR